MKITVIGAVVAIVGALLVLALVAHAVEHGTKGRGKSDDQPYRPA
jgi:hypothetical protein